MKIVLRIDGKDKTFLNDFVTGLIYRRALQLNKKITTNPDLGDDDVYDDMVEFVVAVFNKQFTTEEVWEGIRFDRFESEIRRVFQTVLGVYEDVDDEEQGLEGNEAGK